MGSDGHAVDHLQGHGGGQARALSPPASFHAGQAEDRGAQGAWPAGAGVGDRLPQMTPAARSRAPSRGRIDTQARRPQVGSGNQKPVASTATAIGEPARWAGFVLRPFARMGTSNKKASANGLSTPPGLAAELRFHNLRSRVFEQANIVNRSSGRHHGHWRDAAGDRLHLPQKRTSRAKPAAAAGPAAGPVSGARAVGLPTSTYRGPGASDVLSQPTQQRGWFRRGHPTPAPPP